MFNKKSNWYICLVFVFLTSGLALGGTPGFSPQAVKQLYKDGDFEKVRTQLEAFLKRSDATATRDERILAYKYLGVVYASKPEGAPQAEAYFFRLLDLSPKVTLAEMYVSSTVNNLFEKTQARFEKERKSSSAVDEFGHPIAGGTATSNDPGDGLAGNNPPGQNFGGVDKNRAPIQNTPRQHLEGDKKGVAIWPWVLGAVVVGGGIGVYVMVANESGTTTETVFNGTPKQ